MDHLNPVFALWALYDGGASPTGRWLSSAAVIMSVLLLSLPFLVMMLQDSVCRPVCFAWLAWGQTMILVPTLVCFSCYDIDATDLCALKTPLGDIGEAVWYWHLSAGYGGRVDHGESPALRHTHPTNRLAPAG